MDVNTVAKEFVALMKEGKDQEAQDRFWADDIRSVEAMPGEHSDVTGREALAAKHAWWEANSTMHGYTVTGPMVHGDQFAVFFTMDVTMKDMGRLEMQEVGLYTVRDGKVVEERFFYGPYD
ncbi:MAG: nuclear transport factor 2 family protein [Pseudomonadota bacterium]